MAKLPRRKAEARRVAHAVYADVRANPQDYLGVSGTVKLDARTLVCVGGFNPSVDLKLQLSRLEREGTAMERMTGAQQRRAFAAAFEQTQREHEASYRMYAKIERLLRSGTETREVQDYIRKHQQWPCFALAATEQELEEELAARYALGRCEVDFWGVDLPDSVLVGCRMLPYEW